ncbi:MAG TPA: ChaN family lipoprotein [Chitinophagales bacterium]|nr:ChaN family lipoprotein [Chitinophagales bacterium]
MPTKVILFFALFIFIAAMPKDAYQLYNKEGKTTTYEQLLKQAADADIVLFGELHNNPICHWLQLELTSELFEKVGKNLTLGAEMFETDNQLLLNEYLNGLISRKSFEEEARLWKNYTTDYKPLVEFAKTNQLPFIATNIPRRYASAVFNNGIEHLQQLSPQAQQFIAPVPFEIDITLPGYQAMLQMGGHGTANSQNMPKAQAAKDATMAHFILQNWKKGKLFVHFNGAYHSNHYEGIVWYLKKQNPNLRIITISSVEQSDINSLLPDNLQLADFIICTPEKMTKTH